MFSSFWVVEIFCVVGKRSHIIVCGVGTIDLKFTLKIKCVSEDRTPCPLHQKKLLADRLCAKMGTR
jgi:hypothetical protein